MKIYEIEAGQKRPVKNGIKKIVPLIQQNCQQALTAMHDAGAYYLYRGVKGIQTDAFISQSRTNRQPSASASTFHRNINLAFSAAGFKANRTNSIFVTASIGEAANYKSGDGAIYLIFPIDGFSFTWSPKIEDLFVNEYSLFGREYEDMQDRFRFYHEDDPSPELIQKFLEKSQYRDTDFAAAIKSGNEIMVSGNYYAVNAKYKDWPEFRQLIGDV